MDTEIGGFAMNNAVEHMLEIIIGVILFVLAMIYLTSQNTDLNCLTDLVQENLIERDTIYQQEADSYPLFVTHTHLYAIMMGYREYPIMIEGRLLEANNSDYEEIISLIKEGNYEKHYEFNEYHEIQSVIFKYIGIL